MLTYKAGQIVGKGTYWDVEGGQRIDVMNEAVLSGRASAAYIRVSPALMLLSGPFLGLLYAVLMPFIGIAAAAVAAATRLASGMYGTAVKSVSFGWRPRNAYLSGKKKQDEDEPLGHC